VEADTELRDHVGSLAGFSDQLPKHLGGPAAVDRDDAASLEAERDWSVNEPLDCVRDRQVGDEHAVGAVLQRRDEHLAAREVAALTGLERQRVAQPRTAVDAEPQVGACASADVDLLGAFQLREQAPRRLLELGLRLRELVFEQLRRDER
jgi:hypothetical protein